MANTGALGASAVDPASHDSTAAALVKLLALVEAQARTIRDYEAAMAHSAYILEHASAAARLGVWECDLATENLSWSQGTYDLFDVPRGTPLIRERTLGFYEHDSLTTLQAVRSRALATRKGFSLDAAIVTPKGTNRWIRIHATVASSGDRPASIFGIKQDITEEKILADRLRYFAEVDDLTSLANRNKFQAELSRRCSQPDHQTRGALLLIDLDGFKNVNDTFGHMTGDECLKESAKRLQRVCGKTGFVARIGGDEFAVLLGPQHVSSAPHLATRIIAALSQPIDCNVQRYKIGASVGIAAIEGCPAPEVFRRADTALYAAKVAGRQTYRVFGAT